MKQQELDLILIEHSKWLNDSSTGSRADLSFTDLSSANLSSANLSYANLSYANLRSADLSSADLRSADLSFTDLSSANLSSANLSYADLRSANLSYANLSYANDQKWICDGKSHQLTNIGSEKGVLELFSCGDLGWLIRRGCFTGSKNEFIKAVSDTHKDNIHAKKYLALINALCD